MASMVMLQQLQQQMLLGSLGAGMGGGSGSSGSQSGSSNNRNSPSHSNSGGSGSNSNSGSAAAAALSSQLAALNQQMMNPLYSYQALAMAQAMAGLGGASGSGSSGNVSARQKQACRCGHHVTQERPPRNIECLLGSQNRHDRRHPNDRQGPPLSECHLGGRSQCRSRIAYSGFPGGRAHLSAPHPSRWPRRSW